MKIRWTSARSRGGQQQSCPHNITSEHYISLLLFVYMFPSFIRPLSGGRYKYMKENCAVEGTLPWQSTWYNTLNILLQHTSSIFICIFFLTMVEWTTETCRREIIMKDVWSSDGMLCGVDCCRLPVTTGCCCLNSRKMWKVSICEAFFSGNSMVIQYRYLRFCSFLQINLYFVGVRVQIKLFFFAYWKLAEFGIECHILSTVESLSEELLMSNVLHNKELD